MTHTAVVPLGEIADLQAGVGFPPDLQGRTSGDYPVAKVGDISRVGRAGEAVINTADHFVDQLDLVRLKARPIPVGSVLFAKIGEAIRQNHRVIAGCELLVDNNAMAAIPLGRVESRYLFHFLRTVDFYALASATTVPALRKSDLQRLPVPLPPLPDQRRIAEILDKADALRAKRRAALAQLDTLTQSIFLDMFGDPATNPKEWPRLQLGDLSDKVKTWNPTSKPQDEFIYIDIAAIDQVRKRITGARRILGTDAPSRARQQVCTGDVLISTVRPNLNAVATIDDHLDGATASTGFCVLRPRETRINSAYLFALVRHDAFIGAMVRQASGASYPAVTDAIVRAWLAPCPPIELQREYARRMKGLARVQARGEASLDEFEGLFASLQHRAFRGEL